MNNTGISLSKYNRSKWIKVIRNVCRKDPNDTFNPKKKDIRMQVPFQG